MAIAVGSYTILFSWVTILKYLALRSSAYDLGIYNQALFTATRFGRFFYYTPDLPANPGGSVFGAHFMPIFFALAPIYALIPGPETLLVIQSFVLAIAAVPLYFLGTKLSSQKNIGLLFAVLYLMSPLVQGVNWLDFHPEAFVPLAFLTAFYAMETGRWKLYFAGILLALSSLEFTGVLVSLFGAIEIYTHRTSLVAFLRHRKFLEPGPVGLITLILSVCWTAVAVGFIHVFNPSQTFLFGGNFSWSVLGARSLVGVPFAALMDPERAILAMSYGILQKTVFLALVLVPFVLFLKWGFRIAVLTVPWLFASVTSNQSAYYMFNDQYSAFLAPFLFAAAVYGYVKLRGSRRMTRRRLYRLTIVTVSTGLIVALLVSPFVNTSTVGYVVFGNRGIPTVGAHDQLASMIIGLIPPEASVLTQYNLFPLVSNRLNAFLYPYQTYYPAGTSYNSTLSSFIQKSEYILLDVTTDTWAPPPILDILAASSNFGLYAAADGILLYRAGYHAPPAFFLPIRAVWTAHDLSLQSGAKVVDTSSIQQSVILHSSSEGNSPIWSGPDRVLPPGRYLLDFRIRIGGSTNNSVTALQATSSLSTLEISKITDSSGGYSLLFREFHGPPKVQSQLILSGANFTGQGYQDFFLPLELENKAYLNFAAAQLTGEFALYVDQISLVQLPPT